MSTNLLSKANGTNAVPPIALVGDYSREVIAHEAINRCFAPGAFGQAATGISSVWLPTESIAPGDERSLVGFSGIWCVPASPYRNMAGALWAIEYARTRRVPFLGTCGGYQHALLEYARNVLGLKQAGHTETDPTTPLPLLHRMDHSLREQSQEILVNDDEFALRYGTRSGVEAFNCGYGLNPAYENLFADAPLQIVARSRDGEARAFRLQGHPFFMGVAFQPERRALQGLIHPLVSAFMSRSAACR